MKRGGEVGKLRSVDGVIIGGGLVIVAVDVRRRRVVKVVLRGVDGLIRAPFNDLTPILQERLAVGEGKGFKTSNIGVGDRHFNPAVARDAGPGGKGHEMEGALGVPGGVESNRPGNECVACWWDQSPLKLRPRRQVRCASLRSQDDRYQGRWWRGSWCRITRSCE